MRAFVAVEVPSPQLPGVRSPADGAPSHLTVLFLGDVADAVVQDLSAAFARVVAIEEPFQLSLRGLGTFPPDGRPRVLFARLAEGAGTMSRIHDRLAEAARALGVRFDDRPFVPHLTLLRVRSPRDEPRVRELQSEFLDTPFGSVDVRELLLKSSVLGSGGATHRVEARFPVHGPGAGASPTGPGP
jgi:2'-5' RNA ligase